MVTVLGYTMYMYVTYTTGKRKSTPPSHMPYDNGKFLQPDSCWSFIDLIRQTGFVYKRICNLISHQSCWETGRSCIGLPSVSMVAAHTH